MSESTESKNPRTFQATAAQIAQFSLVKLDANEQISVATATTDDNIIGAVSRPVATSEYGAVNLLNAGGSFFVTLGETATVNDAIYPAAGGQAGVSVISGKQVGIALQNGVSGDVIEVLKV